MDIKHLFRSLTAPEIRVGYLFTGVFVDEPFTGYLAVGCDDDLVVWPDGDAIDIPRFEG